MGSQTSSLRHLVSVVYIAPPAVTNAPATAIAATYATPQRAGSFDWRRDDDGPSLLWDDEWRQLPMPEAGAKSVTIGAQGGVFSQHHRGIVFQHGLLFPHGGSQPKSQLVLHGPRSLP